MKNFIVFMCVCFSVLTACKNKEEEKGECCKKPETETSSSAVNSDITLHDITSEWTTHDNRKVKFSDFNNKVTVVAMIFTNCLSACPRITADLQRIESGISKENLKDVSFLLITMDPARDNPEQLTKFATEHQLDLKRWTLLTGSDSDILEIANVLNVRISKTDDGNFDHSNIIHIVNSKGNIVYQQIGLAQEPKESIENINKLINN